MGDKIYPIGIQNFEKIRNEGYYYVDKTALIYRLVKTGSYYFLSRPRRFGKSLLISTLEAYFLGKKELFEGLAMAQLEKNWIRRPVLHLDLNIGKYDAPDSLDKILEEALSKWDHGKAVVLQCLHHHCGVPAVIGNFADVIAFAQFADEFFNETIVNNITFGHLNEALSFPLIVHHVIPPNAQCKGILRQPEKGQHHVGFIFIPWRKNQHQRRQV